MKLIINYDLVNEIMKANTGFDFKRFASKMAISTGVIVPINFTTHAINPEAHSFISLLSSYMYSTFIFGSSELALKSINIKLADLALKQLSSSLTKINIYTDAESIKKARLYKIQYKIIHEDKPAIQQNRFMMLPTTGTFNADEVSLQEEHIIGSKEYVLSIGEPKKKHSEVTSKVLSL